MMSGVEAFSQGNVGINSTGNNPDASSVLDIAADGATKGGLLIPRVSLTSTTDVTTIATPANALVVYNTNAGMTNGNGAGFYYYSTAAVKWIYVDAASNGPGTAGQVFASQGSGNQPQWTTLSTSGGCLPLEISNTEWATVNWMTCGTNCASLVENGNSDWRMPTVEEYAYARQQFAAPTGGWLGAYFWTRVVDAPTSGEWVVFYEGNGNWCGYNNASSYDCRCVR